jgi:hypothetical protein
MRERINTKRRHPKLGTVNEKQDDTDCGKNECDPDPRPSGWSQLALCLQVIPESGTKKDY